MNVAIECADYIKCIKIHPTSVNLVPINRSHFFKEIMNTDYKKKLDDVLS